MTPIPPVRRRITPKTKEYFLIHQVEWRNETDWVIKFCFSLCLDETKTYISGLRNKPKLLILKSLDGYKAQSKPKYKQSWSMITEGERGLLDLDDFKEDQRLKCQLFKQTQFLYKSVIFRLKIKCDLYIFITTKSQYLKPFQLPFLIYITPETRQDKINEVPMTFFFFSEFKWLKSRFCRNHI